MSMASISASLVMSDVARSFGCRSWLVEKSSDFDRAFGEALKVEGPAIIEVMTDENVTLAPPWVPTGAAA